MASDNKHERTRSLSELRPQEEMKEKRTTTKTIEADPRGALFVTFTRLVTARLGRGELDASARCIAAVECRSAAFVLRSAN